MMVQHVESIQVWDHWVRWLHWSLAVAVAIAWISTLGWGLASLHDGAGYVALGVVAIRVLHGFTGSHYARFKQFVCSPRVVLSYASRLRTASEPRYLGHNPLGGWMVIALLTSVACAGFTGWLFTTDIFWGYVWLKWLHATFAWIVVVLITLHLGGVIFTSLRHRENLLRSMFSGKKALPRDKDQA